MLIRGVRIVDESTDTIGTVVVEDGLIADVILGSLGTELGSADMVIEGGNSPSSSVPALVLMPAFVELHAHFRDPGFPLKETLESGSLAAVAGGYGTVVCMANTDPVMDDPRAAAALKDRAKALGLIDLYPALSLTRGMGGRDTTHLAHLRSGDETIRMLSEDGKDVAEDGVFAEALSRAAELGIPVSCHCDAGGSAAAASKERGDPRSVWSRIEENVATARALSLAETVGCHIHVAHVSTKEAVAAVRQAKRKSPGDRATFRVTAEATPHHIALTEKDAGRLGAESYGRVNPSLRTEDDRRAVIEGLLDGTIDAIATDHAPHAESDKAAGAPGFSGLETAFAVSMGDLVTSGKTDLKGLSQLMSANPCRILGLRDRGVLASGLRADLVLIEAEAEWLVYPQSLRSRGKNTPFAGSRLRGRIALTLHGGRIVYDGRESI